jgi:predicted DNA-binding transcriptional regulator AlpA
MKDIVRNSPLLHEAQAAKLLAVSPAWLQRKRWEGGGPRFIRHGRAIRYEETAIFAWIDSHRVTPTEETAR